MQIRNVFLVNDDAASLCALGRPHTGAARSGACALITAGSGDDALRPGSSSPASCGVRLAGNDRFATAAAIDAHPRSRAVPIIVSSADAAATRPAGLSNALHQQPIFHFHAPAVEAGHPFHSPKKRGLCR